MAELMSGPAKNTRKKAGSAKDWKECKEVDEGIDGKKVIKPTNTSTPKRNRKASRTKTRSASKSPKKTNASKISLKSPKGRKQGHKDIRKYLNLTGDCDKSCTEGIEDSEVNSSIISVISPGNSAIVGHSKVEQSVYSFHTAYNTTLSWSRVETPTKKVPSEQINSDKNDNEISAITPNTMEPLNKVLRNVEVTETNSCSNNGSRGGVGDADGEAEQIKGQHPKEVDQSLKQNEDEMEDISNKALLEVMRGLMTQMKTDLRTEMKNDMQQEIQKATASLKNEIQTIAEKENANSTKIEEIVKRNEKQDNEMVKVRDELTECKENMSRVVDALKYQSLIVAECTNKMGRMDAHQIKSNLFIGGIKEVSDENCKQRVSSFFKDKLKIQEEIGIIKAFRTGEGKYRSIKVILQNSNAKGLIYKNVSNLKGLKNETDGKAYQVSDHLTPLMNAAKQKNRRWIRENKKDTASQIELSIKRGELQVNGQPVQPHIQNPKVADLLNLNQIERDEINKAEIRHGPEIKIESSTFCGFVCDVRNFEEVNKAYKCVRLRCLKARHVISAARVPGSSVIDREDYCDDNEHNAGSRLLDLLQDAGIECRAVFVARYYEGEHIGPQRYDAITRAASLAINEKPFNTITQIFQFAWNKLDVKQGGSRHSLPSDRKGDRHYRRNRRGGRGAYSQGLLLEKNTEEDNSDTEIGLNSLTSNQFI